MALDATKKVKMPEKGVTLRKVKDKTYVYYVTATYRNEKGKPTCDRSSIGKYDEESGMLIPNRNYYEIYLKEPAPQQKAVFEYGVNYVFEQICKKLGIIKLLKSYFPENYKEILTIAQYMLAKGNVMYYVDDYTEVHKTACENILTDSRASKVFSNVREEDILLFFRNWIQKAKQNEYIAYDVTSFSSYSSNINELEWGYNRDKEKIPQINMGMYYGQESKLPLYYRIYPGSISDKAHLQYMVKNNELISTKKTRFVMDRGFYSADNLRYLTDNYHRFVIALPSHLKYCKNLIKNHANEIINHSRYSLGLGLPYAKAFEVDELGFRMKVHLYYDPAKANRESVALYDLINRQENDLKLLKEPPEKKLKYDKFFLINRAKDGSLAFKKNYEAIDEALQKCGFFLIAETDFEKSSEEILKIYRNRDMIEKSFDELKNEIDMKRLRSHSIETANGKIFVSFIALIVKSFMLKQLGDHMKENNLSFKKILTELSKIKCFDFGKYSKPQLINPVSKKQRDIFALLDVDCIG